MNDNSISVYQARYATFIIEKYLDTATLKESKKFYNNNLQSDMIFNKADASTSYEQVDNLLMELNINYRSCIGSFVDLLSTKVYLSFVVPKLAKVSSKLGQL